MFNYDMPKSVQEKINEYERIGDDRKAAVGQHNDRAEELSAEKIKKETELKALVDEGVRNPSKLDEAKETELRRDIASLEFQITGAQDRAKRARSLDRDDQNRAAIDAIQTAKDYSDRKYRKEYPEKLQAIAEAKTAYLQTLADYHDLKEKCTDVVHEAARQTQPNKLDHVGRPYASRHPIAWNHHDSAYSDGSRYTVTTIELNNALDHGVVKQDGKRV
ncbi:hypothetical protein HUG15_00370 [Salicibibacter cibarius]|uniref:Uncharacterized protein n=1 Tax=Salicibibacter cibarius TaxID=2743000 RepID=A0A7T7C9V5_9BACI|nr:hypothetical protein [Salicibibacter cibarius]QQK74223.1 hypothetical protein HUG15_00370 [Salicibibacter cibarius]